MFTPLNLVPGFEWSPLLRSEQSLEDKIGKHISDLLRSEALPRFQPLIGPIAHTHNGVFAFAMTLLAINLLPYADFGAAPSAEQFFQRLLSQAFL
jgi:hypothetical protein